MTGISKKGMLVGETGYFSLIECGIRLINGEREA